MRERQERQARQAGKRADLHDEKIITVTAPNWQHFRRENGCTTL